MVTITPVDIGAAPDDGTGDPLRTAYNKINGNEANLNSGKSEVGHTHTLTDITDSGGLAAGDNAGDVPFTPNGTISSTNTQAAVQEVRDEAPLISSEDELVGQMQIAVVATLPGTPDANTLYFVTT